MLMMLKESGDLIELKHPETLWDPYEQGVEGWRLSGEEQQDLETYSKGELIFLSKESLPKCWCDVHYRDSEWQRYNFEPAMTTLPEGPTSYYGA
ncbi:MAG: acetyltransferase [Cellvibrionaceae bacterium]|nr:acetyltransferase [Cellvibrionaceae bacterium]|tara:strand:- start:1772 stop:2053 length:282 start_codon:yes stop_codon:yes gene_type:complete